MENKLKKCPNCGSEIASVTTQCPICGYNFLQTQMKVRAKGKSTIGRCSLVIGIIGLLFSLTELGVVLAVIGLCLGVYVLFSKKELYYGTAIAGVAISIFAIIIFSIPTKNNGTKKDNKSDTYVAEATETPNNDTKTESNKKTKPTVKPENKKAWEKAYENSDIQFVDLGFLSKNAKYYKGQSVISVSKIYEIGDSDLQFDTDDSNYFKEITCKFKCEKELVGLDEGDTVCFIGKVSDINTYFGNDTVTIKDCYLVSKGKDVSKYHKKIKDAEKQQEKYVANVKKKQKQDKKKAAKEKKSSYMKKCKAYPYKKIQRHPDSYKGKKIKVSGTVIQVMEGWLDTVSLRVEDSSGNVWYVNYGYSENEKKILEDDKITVYGESTGTETYTTVLGSSQTIPSIDAKYIK